jgi:glycosyltransferase involved in cell wall biosynthesis
LGRTTGLGRYVTHLAQDLGRTDSGVNFQALVLPSDEKFYGVRRIEVRKFMAVPVMNPQQHLAMPFELLRLRPKLYHYPSCDAPLGSQTLIATCLDLEPLCAPELFRRRIVLYYKLFARRLRQAIAIVAISQQTADDVQRMLRIPSSRIRVIPLGVDARFRPGVPQTEIAEARARYGLPEEFVLYVGNTMPHKNVPRIVEAFARVRQAEPRLMLVLAGRPDSYRTLVENAIRAAGVVASVRFLNYVDEVHLPAVYAASQAMVFPSLYEGFGMPVLEALACGTPVITSDRGSLAEIAGSAAMLVDPRDPAEIAEAMAVLIRGGSEASRLRAAGPVRAATFTWAQTAEKHAQLYKEFSD